MTMPRYRITRTILSALPTERLLVLLRWILDELLVRYNINVDMVQTVELSLPADTSEPPIRDVVFEPESYQ